MSFWDIINQWDTRLFLQINHVWTNGFLDYNLPWYRDENTWFPLYLFLLIFVFWNFGWRAWPWLLCIIACAALSDQLSSNFIKNFFMRPRPCSDPIVGPYTRLLIARCPSSGSFTSSHATNHFATAMFFYKTLKPYLKKWSYGFFFIAATVCYAQVYIGVHYPLDVIGGGIIGCLLGMTIAYIFNTRIGFPKDKVLAFSHHIP
jgi:membrane-associated phospholipid phosphatase